ncbi:MAG: hypothetical protein KJ760_18020, partial [Proteobacteria bacterium]|nr:hypothetical protein [Pseudomonadota bacterium]
MIPIVILIILSYCLPLVFISHKDWKKICLIWGILTIYHAVSFINGFFFRTPGADVDALDFHTTAVALSETGVFRLWFWADLYTNLLTIVYSLADSNSIMVGQSMSIIFVSLSIIVFIRFFELIRSDKSSMSVLVLFLLPSMILMCSVTLRESYEIFFSLLSFYCFSHYFYSKKKIQLIFSAIAAFFMVLFHPVLSIWALFLFLFIVLEASGISLKTVVFFFAKRKIVVLIAIGLCLTMIPVTYKQTNDVLKGENLVSSLVKGNLVHHAIYWRNMSIMYAEISNANAIYGVPLEVDSIPAFFSSISKIGFYYFAAPLPWKVSRLIDVYATTENLWRILLIILSLKSISRYHEKKYLLNFLFFSYLLISVVWAMGTVNFGTAMRHHLIGYWLLVLLGFPELEAFFMRRVKNKG